MDLVLGAEWLFGKQTGIGRYNFELGRRLWEHEHVDSLSLLAYGRLWPAKELLTPTLRGPEKDRKSLLGQLRSTLAGMRPAMALYERILPSLERRALAHLPRGTLLHSPAYLLPSWHGRRVVTIHDLSTYRGPQYHPAVRAEYVNRHIRYAAEHADHVITVSETVRAELVDHFPALQGRVSVAYNAADPVIRPLEADSYERALRDDGWKPWQTPPYGAYFLFTASIEPRKNLDRVLDAYLAYIDAVSGDDLLPLIIAGDRGWNSAHTHRRLRTLAQTTPIRYLGFVPESSLRALMAGARALLYPSLYEGFGLPVIEALQSGTRVITSRGTAMEEIAGNVCVLVDPLDTQSIAEAMTALAGECSQERDEALRAGMAHARNFSWERATETTVNVYRQLLER